MNGNNTKVIKEHQRVKEPLEDTIARLMRKYGYKRVLDSTRTVASESSCLEPFGTSSKFVEKGYLLGKRVKYGVPETTLHHWSLRGVIPVLTGRMRRGKRNCWMKVRWLGRPLFMMKSSMTASRYFLKSGGVWVTVLDLVLLKH